MGCLYSIETYCAPGAVGKRMPYTLCLATERCDKDEADEKRCADQEEDKPPAWSRRDGHFVELNNQRVCAAFLRV